MQPEAQDEAPLQLSTKWYAEAKCMVLVRFRAPGESTGQIARRSVLGIGRWTSCRVARAETDNKQGEYSPACQDMCIALHRGLVGFSVVAAVMHGWVCAAEAGGSPLLPGRCVEHFIELDVEVRNCNTVDAVQVSASAVVW